MALRYARALYAAEAVSIWVVPSAPPHSLAGRQGQLFEPREQDLPPTFYGYPMKSGHGSAMPIGALAADPPGPLPTREVRNKGVPSPSRERATAEIGLMLTSALATAGWQAGFKFRQQVPIDHFIVDFACLSERLIVGSMAEPARIEVAGREGGGVRKIRGCWRVWNSDVKQKPRGVDPVSLRSPPPTPPARGEPTRRTGGASP
jgi:hypothetical protein